MKITHSTFKLVVGLACITFGLSLFVATLVGVISSSEPRQWESILRVGGLGIAYLALGLISCSEKHTAW